MPRLLLSTARIIRFGLFRTYGISHALRSCNHPRPSTFRGREMATDSRSVSEFKVCKFGELIVRSESICNFNVASANPQLFPDQDRAVFEFQPGLDTSMGLNFACVELDETSRLNVTRSNACLENNELDTCSAKVPIKYDVDILVTNHRSLSVESMQNDFVKVESELGDCSLSNIQTRSITAKTGGGNIISEGLLQGDAVLEAKLDGNVKLFKPLCRHLVVKTDRGDITIGNLYADRSSLTSNSGNIDIRNAHRAIDIIIAQKGSVSINSLDGDLTAKINLGNISVYASRHGRITINVEQGDVTLKVPEELTACRFDVSGNTVVLDDKLNQSSLRREEIDGRVHVTGLLSRRGDEESPSSCSIYAHSRGGRVDVLCQDFISSLNLSKYATYDDDNDD